MVDSTMSMAPVLVATKGCQARAYFDNEYIPPGVHRPRLPWAYTYGQFEALLLAYPTVHPEDFVTFGVLQAQPRRAATPSSHVSSGDEEMATDEEDRYLGPRDDHNNSSDDRSQRV